MANPFAVERKTDGDLTIVSIKGFVDAHTAPQFEEAVQEEIDNGRFRLVVECSEMTYISSAGLGVFMGFVEEARENEGDIKIVGVTDKVRQVFDLLGFGAIFQIVDDLTTAKQQFADGVGGPDGD